MLTLGGGDWAGDIGRSLLHHILLVLALHHQGLKHKLISLLLPLVLVSSLELLWQFWRLAIEVWLEM